MTRHHEHPFAWLVEGTLPQTHESGKTWRKNVNFTVIAASLEGAVEKTREQYPEIEFIKVFRDRYIEAVIT